MEGKREESYISIHVDRLVPGLFIDIGLQWTDHPFLFRRFRIKNADEIQIIRSLVSEVKFCASKSTVGVATEEDPQAKESVEQLKEKRWQEKKQRLDNAQAYRQKRREVGQRYAETAKRVKLFNADLKTAPANAIRDAQQIATGLAQTASKTDHILIDLINLPDSAFSGATHALNVTVLALCLAKAMNLNDELILDVAAGALLHDVGKSKLPISWFVKKEKLSAAQAAEVNKHPLHGVDLIKNLTEVDLSNNAQLIVAQHHELIDGTGFPRGVKGRQVSLLAQMVAIANIYDNLCNPANMSEALNPKAAMGTLFSKYNGKFDEQLLNVFVRSMGIYPPGTLVNLSDGSIGLVVNVDAANLLKPNILLYNPDIPKKDALMICLADMSGLTISSVLSIEDCPQYVRTYLGLRERLAYFISEGET